MALSTFTYAKMASTQKNDVLNCFLVGKNNRDYSKLYQNRYGSPTTICANIKCQTMSTDFSNGWFEKFVAKKGHTVAGSSTQSCIYIETPDRRRFLMTSKFYDRPYPHDNASSELIVQVLNTVFWLDRNDPTTVLGTFRLSKPIRFYHDASISDGILSVRYVPESDIIHDDPDHFEMSELLTEVFPLERK